MWQPSKLLLLFIGLFLLFSSTFAQATATNINPFFRDSILKHKVDTARWSNVESAVNRYNKSATNIRLQKPKVETNSLLYLYMTAGIVILLIIMRLIFDDFSTSLLEGMLSMKKFFVFYKSKKYDSLIAIILVYVFNLVLLSLISFIAWSFTTKHGFKTFNMSVFMDISVLMIVFFTLKNAIEYLFNFIIDTQDTFKAFFLQNLFTEFLLCVVLLVFSLIYIYNSYFSLNWMLGLFFVILTIYLVFNTIRSYQLISVTRLPYKLHFFLYICTFKLIPILLLVKYFLNNIV